VRTRNILKQHSRCRLGHDKDSAWCCLQCLEKKKKKRENDLYQRKGKRLDFVNRISTKSCPKFYNLSLHLLSVPRTLTLSPYTKSPEIAHHRKKGKCSQISSKGLSLLKVFHFRNKDNLESIYNEIPDSRSLSFRVKEDRMERGKWTEGWLVYFTL